jgi:signal transduction histidine kinase
MNDVHNDDPIRDRVPSELGEARDGIARRQAITLALSEALLPSDVARVAAKEMAALLGAEQSLFALPAAGERLQIITSSGFGPDTISRLGEFSIHDDFPAARAFRTGQSSWIRSKDELFREHPRLPSAREKVIVESTACIPLVVKERTLGVLAFGFRERRTFAPDERATAEDLARQAGLALERARLYEVERSARLDAEQRGREMEMLFRLAETTAAVRELDTLYEEALRGVRDVLGVERASILLCDAAGTMRFRAWRGLSDAYRRAVEGHSPWPDGTTDARPIFVADAARDPTMSPYRALLDAEGIKSLGFIPIVGERRLLGKFMIYSETPRTLSPHEEHLAITIATHIAQAVGRLSALDAERATARRLEDLARLSRKFVETGLQTQRLVESIVDGLGATMDSTATIYLASEDDADTLCGVASYHPDRALRERIADHHRRSPLRRGEGVAGAVAKSGRSELAPLVDGTFAAARLPPELREIFADHPIRSLLCVPLRFGEQIVGALELTRTSPDAPFTRDDLTLCEELADRTALALLNARLFEQAEKAREAREDVLAIVSHDLRDPLGAVLFGATSALRLDISEKTAVRVRKNLLAIHRSAERMSRLLADLVDFAALQSGALPIDPHPFPPSEVVEAVVEMCGPPAGERGVRLESNVEGGLPLLDADRDRLIQALGNFVSNAVKVTPSGGRVGVICRRHGDRISYAVEDTGPGMPPDEIPHVFERYWRGRQAGYRGTGLGLTIAKGIVDAHGGDIRAESTVGVGSTFFFSLPFVRSERSVEKG